MSKSRLFAIAVVWWLTNMALASADDMKCPNGWNRLWTRFQQVPRSDYFHCDYTTKTCERGYMTGHERVFELLAEDRTTVIGHGFCDSSMCVDFDRGIMGNRFATLSALKNAVWCP